MNKKGFTIIEVLITVTIVLLVGITSVVGFFTIEKNAKDKKYYKTVEYITSAAEVYVNLNKSLLDKVNKDCCEVNIPIGTLVNNGLIEEKDFNKIKKKEKEGLISLNDQVTVKENCDGAIAYEFDGYIAGEITYNCTNKMNSIEAEITELKETVEKLKNTKDNTSPGIITIWSGRADKIPDGWVLCNGDNGTPNLKDKFVLGSIDNGSIGETNEKKTIKIPGHSHNIAPKPDRSGGKDYYHYVDGANNNIVGVTRNYTTTSNNPLYIFSMNPYTSKNEDQEVEYMPPYYSLAYIMKK